MACGYGINANSSELKDTTLDKGHAADLVEEANTHRRLLGMKMQGSLQDTLPLPCRMRHAVHVCRWLERWQQPPTPARTKAYKAAEPTQPTKATGKGKAKRQAAKAKPAPQPGRWLDRDCNAALNMQRIGESRWRPLELCYWPDQGALPAKGKEYPGLGYKRLREKAPKAQQQQPAVAQ
ncbi:hypothetical protein QJQ45_011441 [Haematococcus lacustris]|nr:hypothetical protein QJQ45_011441 [Haematococcus lacustris]